MLFVLIWKSIRWAICICVTLISRLGWQGMCVMNYYLRIIFLFLFCCCNSHAHLQPPTDFPLNGNLIRYVRFMYQFSKCMFIRENCSCTCTLRKKGTQLLSKHRFVKLQILCELYQTSDSECVLNCQVTWF